MPSPCVSPVQGAVCCPPRPAFSSQALEASAGNQQQSGIFRLQRQGRHCPVGHPIPGSPSCSSCPRPRCPGHPQNPTSSCFPAQGGRVTKTSRAGRGARPWGRDTVGRGLCLSRPSDKPWGGVWSAPWTVVTWSRRSSTSEVGDPRPPLGARGRGGGAVTKKGEARLGRHRGGSPVTPWVWACGLRTRLPRPGAQLPSSPACATSALLLLRPSLGKLPPA